MSVTPTATTDETSHRRSDVQVGDDTTKRTVKTAQIVLGQGSSACPAGSTGSVGSVKSVFEHPKNSGPSVGSAANWGEKEIKEAEARKADLEKMEQEAIKNDIEYKLSVKAQILLSLGIDPNIN